MNDRDTLALAVSLRRKIHQYPEMGGDEFETTALVARTLKQAGVSFRRYRPTGGVAHLSSGRGPCVAFRADMDALPLTETTPLPFRSRRPGVMHACGHDAHTAMLLTAALRLKKQGLGGTGVLKFFFNPTKKVPGERAKSFVKALSVRQRWTRCLDCTSIPDCPREPSGLKRGPHGRRGSFYTDHHGGGRAWGLSA
jgi:metal-dependent amidase/aminoacylase/carboxypeptidase family protein